MSNSIERFTKRKNLKDTITILEKVEKSHVETFLNSDLDMQKVDAFFKETEQHYDISVSQEEAENFLLKFKKEFNDEKFNKLIGDCKNEVIKSIVTPFGLGKVVAAYDKVGGNVDTVHNVRQGIYATDNEAQKYEDRGDYNSDEYHKDKNYIDINKQYSSEKKSQGTIDYMTDKTIKQNEKHDLDHVVSAKEIHDDPGRVLAEIEGNKLANTQTNLKPTDRTINRSKKADSMKDFLVKKNERIKKLETLEMKETLSPKEEKELKKLQKLQEIDDKKALKADKEARAEQDKKINKQYYTSTKFAKNTVKTGLNEGAKMGMQQAIGLVMTEFFTAVFDEILDIYKNGFTNNFDDKKFFKVLEKRLMTIATRIKNKWKDAAIAFKDGFLSGFISNLVTTVINMFVTTGKRVVRIIREGLFSLFRAIKLLLFPPEDMSSEDAMHEAKKLIATGLIVALGVIIEEWVDTLIKGTAILEPFADTLTAIFVGTITGISITMVVYYIDKKRDDKKLLTNLIAQTDKAHYNIEQSTSII